MTTPQHNLAVIKVVGIGGGGTNAIKRMIGEGMTGVDFIALNTDEQDLLDCDAPTKLDIGQSTTRGLGAGADPAVGERAARDNSQDIEDVLTGADMVFVTAGEGGGTGTGGAPIVAGIARGLGALTVAVVPSLSPLRANVVPTMRSMVLRSYGMRVTLSSLFPTIGFYNRKIRLSPLMRPSLKPMRFFSMAYKALPTSSPLRDSLTLTLPM